MRNSPPEISQLDQPTRQLLQEIDDIELVHVNPKDADRRNAAITLACLGLANLKSFEQSMWELSSVG